MIGLLAGLVGRVASNLSRRPMSRGPLGGLLANRMRSGSGRQVTSMGGGPPPPQAQQQQQDPQQQGQAPPPPQAQPQQGEISLNQPDGSPLASGIQIQPASQQQQQQAVTANLLDEAPSFAPQQPQAEGEVAKPDQVANQTSTLNPVAPQADRQFGIAPLLLGDEMPTQIEEMPEQADIAMEDPNPSKPVDTKSQAYYGQNGPQYNFQPAGSWTAYTPSRSYSRRM